MNKKLLIDTINFEVSPQQLQEAQENSDGRLIVQGVLQRATAKNQNGRVYPKDILAREVAQYKKINIAENRALGELDHPEASVVNLQNVSHNVKDVWWEGDDVMGKVEILGTPSGNILKELLKAGITLGISSRGMGSVKQVDEATVQVEDDFELICWDFVSNPSTQGAFMGMMKESVNKTITNKYGNVNDIITSILCEDGKCRI